MSFERVLQFYTFFVFEGRGLISLRLNTYDCPQSDHSSSDVYCTKLAELAGKRQFQSDWLALSNFWESMYSILPRNKVYAMSGFEEELITGLTRVYQSGIKSFEIIEFCLSHLVSMNLTVTASNHLNYL